MRDSTFRVNDGSAVNEATHLAVGRIYQLSPLASACPFGNLSNQNTPDNETFEIHCGGDIAGEDMCGPLGSLGPQCPYKQHTDTLGECMELCSDFHPYCAAAGWDHEMVNGYGNCYLKAFVDTTQENEVTWTYLAIAKTNNITSTCSNGQYNPTNEATFELTCDTALTGNDINVFHSNSVNECFNSCAEAAAQD